MDSREEIDDETMKRIKIQTSIRLTAKIKKDIEDLKELRSVYSSSAIIEKILEVVVPRIKEKYMKERTISLDGLSIFL